MRVSACTAVQVKLLFRLPVFKGISVSLLRELASIMERRTYRLGSFIFEQGDNATTMFVLSSGTVRIVRRMPVTEKIVRMQQTVCRCCPRCCRSSWLVSSGLCVGSHGPSVGSGVQDPLMMRLLEPQRERQERFVPVPERTLANGRPRSILMSQRPRTTKPAQSLSNKGTASARAGGALTEAILGATAAPKNKRVASARLSGDLPPGATAESSASEPCPMAIESGLTATAEEVAEQLLERAQTAARTFVSGPVVPGLELSGVTADDLEDAGILYDDERSLLPGVRKNEPMASASRNSGAASGREQGRASAAGGHYAGMSRPVSAAHTALPQVRSATCLHAPCSRTWLPVLPPATVAPPFRTLLSVVAATHAALGL